MEEQQTPRKACNISKKKNILVKKILNLRFQSHLYQVDAKIQ